MNAVEIEEAVSEHKRYYKKAAPVPQVGAETVLDNKHRPGTLTTDRLGYAPGKNDPYAGVLANKHHLN